MNLKIKCDTPKEQVLVLRKFKKLVPECKWPESGNCILSTIPYVEYNKELVYLHLEGSSVFWREEFDKESDIYFPAFTAYDFLRNDWKLKSEKSEDEALFLEIQKAVENFNKSLRELEESLRAKYKP